MVAAAAAVLITVGIQIADRPLADLSHVRFTPMAMDPGYNNFPRWAPDGRSFAYMRSGVLLYRSLDAPSPVRLTTQAESMVFSGDGKRIYFTRHTGPQIGRKVWTIAVSGGDPEPLPAEDLGAGYLFDGFTISPDGKALIALRQEADLSFSLVSGSPPGEPWARLPYPPFASGASKAALRFSPDGKQLLAVLSMSPPQFWIFPWPPAAGGAPRRVFFSRSDAFAADWMPDNRNLLLNLYGREGVGGLAVGDSRTGKIYPLELRYAGAGQPAASSDGRFLVPFTDQDTADIVEIPLDGSAPRPLLATMEFEGYPDWSRSGDQMVYMATRAGVPGIWIWSPANDLHRPLVTGSGQMGNAVFSPDGKRVAFTRAGGIWVVPAAGGAPVEVTPPGAAANFPSWSPDGQWLAYRTNRQGKLVLEKIRLGSDRPVTIHETAAGVRPVWSPDGRWISLAIPGATAVVSPDGQVVKKVHGPATAWTATGWSRDGKTLYMAVTEGSVDPVPTTLWAIDPDAGRERAIGHYTGIFLGGAATNPLSPSPDGKSLTMTLVKPWVYIWLVEGLKPPQNFWQRLFARR